MNKLTAHGACGKTWKQRGNRTGHCGGCHETFEGIALFDAHQRVGPDGEVTCLDPAVMTTGPKSNRQPLRFVDGTWRGPKMPDSLKAKYAEGKELSA